MLKFVYKLFNLRWLLFCWYFLLIIYCGFPYFGPIPTSTMSKTKLMISSSPQNLLSLTAFVVKYVISQDYRGAEHDIPTKSTRRTHRFVCSWLHVVKREHLWNSCNSGFSSPNCSLLAHFGSSAALWSLGAPFHALLVVCACTYINCLFPEFEFIPFIFSPIAQ